MTQDQIRGLKADVLGMLMERIEDIFIDFQNAMEVKSEDVSPFDVLLLQKREEKLAELITDILVQQKGEE